MELAFGFSCEMQKAFSSLKPVCDSIAKCPGPEHPSKLRNVLSNLTPEILQEYQAYVLFPIQLHLTNHATQKDDALCNSLKCLYCFLEFNKVNSTDAFITIFHIIFMQVHNPSSPGVVQNVSEERKLLIAKCAKQLLLSSTYAVLENFYSRENSGKLSIAVFTFTQFARHEKYIELRLESLECLLVLAFVYDNNPHETPELLSKVRQVLIPILPGLVSTAIAVVNDADIQNHKIFVLGIRLWARVVSYVLEDSSVDAETNKGDLKQVLMRKAKMIAQDTKEVNFEENVKFQSPEEMKTFVNNLERTKEWLENTSEKLSVTTPLVVKLLNHQHWKVRLEIVDAADLICHSASFNLYKSVPHLIDSVIILSQDDHPSVAKAAKKTLSKLSKNFSKGNNDKVMDTMESGLYDLISQMSRYLRGTDDVLKENKLSLLKGYFELLGEENISRICNSNVHLRKLIKSLLCGASLDFSNVMLLEEVALRDLTEDHLETFDWKVLKNCSTKKLHSTFIDLCSFLGKLSCLPVIVYSLLDVFNDDPVFKKEVILLINYLFQADSPGALSDSADLMESAILAFINPTVWYIPTTVGEGEAKNRAEAQGNVVQVCLLAECVSNLAFAMGREKFTPLQIKCLYPILERAGSPQYLISSVGLKAATKISKLYGNGVSDLVASNVDYLSHHVAVKLKRIHRNPLVLSVLSAIMKHSTADVFPSLHEIIHGVLVQSCDSFHQSNLTSFIFVFYTFLTSVQKWHMIPKTDKPTDQKKSEESFIDSLLLYDKSKKYVESDFDDDPSEEITDANGMEIGEEEEKEKVPDFVQLTIEIVQRILNFLPSKDLGQQVLVLQALGTGIEILSGWQSQLLPVVHKVWSPLVERFHHNNDPLLIQRAFSLLVTLARTSKDFIRARTLQKVLPELRNFLEGSLRDSKLKDSGSAYRLTQKYKLQLLLLSELAPLCLNLEVHIKEINSILDTCAPYLSSQQPLPLQEACVNMYRTFLSQKPEVVWVHLLSLSSTDVQLNPNIEGFRSYKVQGKPLENSQYQKNVKTILDCI